MARTQTNPSGMFISSMARLAAAYRQETDDDQLRIYWDGLSDLEPTKLDRCIDAAIRDCKWFPKIAELRLISNNLPGDKMPQFVDGERVYDCPLCLDGGTVLVWHPDTMRAIRAGKDPKRMTCAVACTCASGDRWSRDRTLSGKRWHPLPRYNEWKMRRPQYWFVAEEDGERYLSMTGTAGAAEMQDLTEWMAAKPIETHPNYNPEFTSYNEGF